MKDELGDLLLQVLFYAQMAKEAGYFDIRDVAAGLNEKLVRRHPHIFAGVEATDAEAVLRNWEQIKREEKRSAGMERAAALLDDVPRTMPALLEAAKLGSKAAKVGFDWPDVRGLMGKLREETAELEAELGDGRASAAAEEELGDLLFTAVNLARHLKAGCGIGAAGSEREVSAAVRAMEAEAGGAERLDGADGGGAGGAVGEGEDGGARGRGRLMTPSALAVRIETLTALEDLQRCVDLQIAVWGYSGWGRGSAENVSGGAADWRAGAGRV